MKIGARIENRLGTNNVELRTGDSAHSLDIRPKPSGYGSSASGGELLFLALATCFVNDLYREAAKLRIRVERVNVEVQGEFDTEGEQAKDVVYRCSVAARASEGQIRDLIALTDHVTEIQNTVRTAVPVKLEAVEVQALPPE